MLWQDEEEDTYTPWWESIDTSTNANSWLEYGGWASTGVGWAGLLRGPSPLPVVAQWRSHTPDDPLCSPLTPRRQQREQRALAVGQRGAARLGGPLPRAQLLQRRGVHPVR